MNPYTKLPLLMTKHCKMAKTIGKFLCNNFIIGLQQAGLAVNLYSNLRTFNTRCTLFPGNPSISIPPFVATIDCFYSTLDSIKPHYQFCFQVIIIAAFGHFNYIQ